MFNPIKKWKNSSVEAKRLFFVGIILSWITIFPVIYIVKPVASPPVRYVTSLIENKIIYNSLYQLYTGEIGNATDGDIALIVILDTSSSEYRNIGIILYNLSTTYLYLLCFFDIDDKVLKSIDLPEFDMIYTVENIDNPKGFVLFFFRAGESAISTEVWLW